VFRRTKQDQPAAQTVVAKEGGKGRPTPTRKEAEAARKARAKGPQDKKGGARLTRQQRAEQSTKMRDAMKTGDDRYLPARDKGPVKRFTRDFVDSRLCMAEFLLPMLLVILLTQPFSPGISNGLWSATVILVAADTVWLTFRLRREVQKRFPSQGPKGATGYAILRSLQLRFLRMPKPQVRLGQKLPERY